MPPERVRDRPRADRTPKTYPGTTQPILSRLRATLTRTIGTALLITYTRACHHHPHEHTITANTTPDTANTERTPHTPRTRADPPAAPEKSVGSVTGDHDPPLDRGPHPMEGQRGTPVREEPQ